jgi:hypothetical protein
LLIFVVTIPLHYFVGKALAAPTDQITVSC